MSIQDWMDRQNKIANNIKHRNDLEMPDETLQALMDSVADPTGLKPFMQEQVKQADEINERIQNLQVSLREQISLSHEERALRIKADVEEHSFTVKWNRINLTVALVGALIGFAGLIVALVSLFAK